MDNDNDLSYSRVEYWTEQFNESLQRHIALQTSADPDVDLQRVREAYIINKLAVLTVANEILGKRIRDLEVKLEYLGSE